MQKTLSGLRSIGSILLATVLSLCQIGLPASFLPKIYADGRTGNVYGSVSNNVNYGSILNAAVTIKDASGTIIAQGNTGDYSSFEIDNVSNGYGYTLTIVPPDNNPNNLVPYVMDLDVYGDTDLNGGGGPITMFSASSQPANPVFSGRILWQGYPDTSGYLFSQMQITDHASNYVQLNSNRYTGAFNVHMPKGNTYELWESYTGGFDPWSSARGIETNSTQPLVNIQRDSYHVYNFDPGYNTVPVTIDVVDQCANPLSGASIVGITDSRISINGNGLVTTIFAHNFRAESDTDSNGRTHLDVQRQGHNGYLGVAYNGNKALTMAIPDTIPDYLKLVANVPSCVNHQDMQAPTIGTFNWSQNPKAITNSSTLTIPATDDSSGIARAEYFIGDSDPGQGNSATMQLTNVQNGGLSANLTTTFGADFPTGVYKISVRAQDNTGNWSAPLSDYLVVYDPAGPKMTGRRTIVPSLSNGDVLTPVLSLQIKPTKRPSA